MRNHPLVRSLLTLRGNPLSCVLTEPLWGIPFNLYAPYVSVYMLALGLKDSQIGLLLSINMILQIFSAAISGAITDKLGRRKTTAFFDFIAWSIPTLIWAFAQDFRFFLVAALFNGTWRITHTSWSCLLVEDADPKTLVDVYSWIYIAGLLAAFFAPIAGLFIARYSLVPTVRGLYLLAFVMMTVKFVILYFYSTETRQGQVRLQETRSQSLFSLMSGYSDVIRQLIRTPRTLFTLGIMLSMTTAITVNNAFWSIIVTQRLHIPEEHIALYPFARSLVMLTFFFLAMPRIKEMKFRNPMMMGLLGLAASQVILITIPEKSYLLLLLSTCLEACSYAVASTQLDRMVAVTVDVQERARITAFLYLVMLTFSMPFGWIAGQMSEINRILPFILNTGLFLIGSVLVFLAARYTRREEENEDAAEPVEALSVS